ncbi:metallophosphoesterase [Bacillus atrophaeus]|uniref:metallophosphoesterase n=1 Tax=Bacillus atrophaeus TaxID=1452 RepID=UPI00227E7BEC|nr:metallophosphoesterase [Bacillus atrophaeus]MCY9203399.1 metallophosphoesterase [Bacillus atrophaeus]MEC0884537.1 metallophosphoesterase [Bacillus atrophaeus]MEC1902230.1 metallophosphoesterase [Bacillus atrophaeus]MEC2397667.1 metallophosphoesterase [Bacillus atrophaeus]MED4434490.1 metallophosphoesterase [Bacillus atrophaeus]
MRKLSRRQFLKGVLGTFAAGLLTAGGGYGYARYLEPQMMVTVKQTIKSPLLAGGLDQFKIVQFSDTHLSEEFSLKDLEKTVLHINDLHPDLIVFTGDLIDKPHIYQDHYPALQTLKKLSAPFGKLCVFGNHDHGGYGSAAYENLMKAAGFEVFRNGLKTIKLLDGSQLDIAALDDLMLGKPDYKGTLSNLRDDVFAILLVHEPDAALKAKAYPVNLQLSGHTHGGQIQLPFYGPLITPPYGKIYTDGMYKVDGMQVYVNRGLGTTRLPLRFLAKPEITIFVLRGTD